MFTPFIVHKSKYFIALFVLLSLFIVKASSATEVRSVVINPSSPAFNQEYTCAITLDQDDHRNACSLLPLDAPSDMFPWDVCRIDHLSNGNLTRNYKCNASTVKDNTKVPGPGNYQLVVWNFTGDGETGQVIYRQNITIVAQQPPTATPRPKPTNPPYIPPTTSPLIPTQIPPQNIPTIIKVSVPTGVEFTFGPTRAPVIPSVVVPTVATSLTLFPEIRLPEGMIDSWKQNISGGVTKTVETTRNSILKPLVDILLNFMREASY